MTDVPEIDCGVFLGVEERGKAVALQFEKAVVVLSAAGALALGYILAERG